MFKTRADLSLEINLKYLNTWNLKIVGSKVLKLKIHNTKKLAFFEAGLPIKALYLTYIEELLSCCNNKIQKNVTGSLQIAVTCWVLRIM